MAIWCHCTAVSAQSIAGRQFGRGLRRRRLSSGTLAPDPRRQEQGKEAERTLCLAQESAARVHRCTNLWWHGYQWSGWGPLVHLVAGTPIFTNCFIYYEVSIFLSFARWLAVCNRVIFFVSIFTTSTAKAYLSWPDPRESEWEEHWQCTA